MNILFAENDVNFLFVILVDFPASPWGFVGGSSNGCKADCGSSWVVGRYLGRRNEIGGSVWCGVGPICRVRRS